MNDSIAERMLRHDNRTSGFDYMRIVLAACVVWSHTIGVVHGQDAAIAAWHTPLRGVLAFVLPMFFCLSGFLVAGSLGRCRTMISFLGLRCLRIFPALMVDTLLAALILGPIFTKLPLEEYFSDAVFHRYFFNLIGHVQFVLPGVFVDNPTHVVNGQLWTLPWELLCYATLTILAFLNLVRYRWLLLTAVILLCVTVPFRDGLDAMAQTNQATTPTTVMLLETFLLGVCAYQFRDKIKLSATVFWLSLISASALFLLPGGDYLAVFPVTYVTVYLGLLNPRRAKLIESGDYSYGVFLYGYPIQQTSVVLFGASALVNVVTSSIAVAALAAFSWWCVEKPALKLRPRLFRFEAWMTEFLLKLPFGHHLVQPPVGPRVARLAATPAG